MVNRAKLKAEVPDDPIGRGYAAMSHQQVVDSLYTKDRPRNRTSMSGSEVFNSIKQSEWNALTDAGQRKIMDVLHLGEINPFGMEQKVFMGVFGGESTTIANLTTARVEMIHRVTELGLGDVKAGHVQQVRKVT